MRKAGLNVHTGAKDMFVDKKYVKIVDESIAVGKQKLLLQLGVSSDTIGKPLTHADVEVIGIGVSPSWKSDDVRKEMEKVALKIGHSPVYCVSDNGHNLCKAIQ